MSKNLKSLGIILLTVLITTGFSGCMKSKYVKYDDIDDIEYAEPTEYAKNFDIEGYISKLPEVEYEKIDYKVKEKYIYEFNGYKMTIDIPEGFEVREIPLIKKPKIVNSTSVEDSCRRDGWRSIPTCGDDKGFFLDGVFVQSGKSLEIVATDDADINECGIVYITPSVSRYRGVSTWDAFVRYILPIKNYNKKTKNGEGLFLVSSPRSDCERYGAKKLLDNKKYFIATGIRYKGNCYNKSCIFNTNLFFSILGSMKIEKK